MKRFAICVGLVCALVVVLGVVAADQHEAAGHTVVTAESMTWGPAPPTLPAGAEMAVVAGDPGSEGLYVLRFRAPAGYVIKPHWHPKAENVTVLSGTFLVAAGESWDDAALEPLGPGGFFSMPGEMPHYAKAETDSLIQLHGIGPFLITYIDPADDPSGEQAASE